MQITIKDRFKNRIDIDPINLTLSWNKSPLKEKIKKLATFEKNSGNIRVLLPYNNKLILDELLLYYKIDYETMSESIKPKGYAAYLKLKNTEDHVKIMLYLSEIIC